MQRRRWFGMAVLAGTLALPALGWSASTTPDIPKMAGDFAKAVGLTGPVTCSTTALPESEVWGCAVPLLAGVTPGPVSFYCHATAGCWIPAGPLPPASSKTP